MKQLYKHLNLYDRCKISTLLKEGFKITSIARRLSVHKSTISREIRRNCSGKDYCNETAETKSVERRRLASLRQSKLNDSNLRERVLDQLTFLQSSPREISGRLKLKHGLLISHETIYKYIWKDKKQGGELYLNLRHRGKKYNKRGSKLAGRGLIPGRIDIDERPKIVDLKSRVGDIEADLIMGADHRGAILSLVDRHSKHTKLCLLNGKSMKEVTSAIIKTLKKVKHHLHTITYDNGKEFANHKEISKKLEVQCFFAKPYHSWERGLNEHTNGLVRQYFPKKTPFDILTTEDVKHVENILNFRPREILGFKTPHEVFIDATLNVALHG
jgi:IS30 family transposase